MTGQVVVQTSQWRACYCGLGHGHWPSSVAFRAASSNLAKRRCEFMFRWKAFGTFLTCLP